MGVWKDAHRQAQMDNRAILAECAAEQARVHSLNQNRCKRMQSEYKMHLINQIHKKQNRKFEMERRRAVQTHENQKVSEDLRDRVIATAVVGRQTHEPVGMETRYREYQVDERNKKRAEQYKT